MSNQDCFCELGYECVDCARRRTARRDGAVVDNDLDALLVEPLVNEAQATAWVYAMHAAGYGTHPDDEGESIVKAGGARLFTDAEAALYDARMDEAHNLVGDVYLIALDAFEGGKG